MSKFFAQCVSWVMHPLLMVSMLFAVLFYCAPFALRPFRDASVFNILLLIFITTFCIPSLSIVALRLTGSVRSLQMEGRQERVMPFSFISVFYMMTTYFFTYKLEVSDNIRFVFIVISGMVLLLTLLTFFIKVSMHSAGIWGVVGFLLAIKINYPPLSLMWPLLGAILLAGVTMSSRLYLNAHRPAEVYLGAGLGFVLCFLSAWLYM